MYRSLVFTCEAQGMFHFKGCRFANICSAAFRQLERKEEAFYPVLIGRMAHNTAATCQSWLRGRRPRCMYLIYSMYELSHWGVKQNDSKHFCKMQWEDKKGLERHSVAEVKGGRSNDSFIYSFSHSCEGWPQEQLGTVLTGTVATTVVLLVCTLVPNIICTST